MSARIASRVITFTLVSAWVSILPSAFGQARGGTTGTTSPGGTSTTGGTTTSPGRTPTTIPNTTQQPPTQTPTMQQPIYVSGKVIMEDGSPLTEPVVIERVCGGSPHSEGYTDSKGYFSVELGGRNNGVLRDASESPGDFSSMNGGMGGNGFPGSGGSSTSGNFGGMGMDNRFMNCDLRARLAGFRSQSVSLANRRALDNPDIGVILLHRLGASESGTTVSATLLAAPKDGRKAYEKGMDSLKKRKPEDAMKSFQKAVEAAPALAPAWFELGRLQLRQQQNEEARKSFEAAIKGDAKFLPPYLEVATMEAQSQKWKEVADLTEQVLKMDSFDYPQAFFYNAVANYNLKNMEQAEKSARQAEKLDTRHQMPKSSHLLGVILYQKHDLDGAAQSFRNYLKFAPGATDADTVRKDLDQIEKATAQAKQDNPNNQNQN
jgi:tetratricopeptide (TPR) repeat protein